MSATLFKKVDYSLAKLIHDIEQGEIGLPDIQRPFVWEATKVRDLFDSMYKGFPVGYLLFWSKDTLSEDFWNIALVNNLESSAGRTPVLFAYYAALNLLDAKVLFSKMKVSELLDPALKTKKSATERHHLFPKGYLHKLGITEVRDTNQIANYALVEWDDNIGISDKSPSEYFPLYAQRFTPEELAQMMEWHALPEGWDRMGYTEFLTERRKLISRVIRKGFEKLFGQGVGA
ncbi:hypothetical protein Psch_00033 [Pelotomaculum schinkii]|uniref:GmrSD restriction endonucleases N-terminal domain-containing protein n=1 Tax=Pelotomaculum schinkii TaxID=78350 RepID=A0A4Y7RCP7_9FIRM|nr:DUF262 domain-containing protein [Pelotomaculum schinkii]TEB06501.1 hypothetical protein Psch_00033 [Pelotomaculum schinkii]